MNADSHFFRNCVAASLLLHAALFLILKGLKLSSHISPVEVDLTMTAFLGTGPAKLGAPKLLVPNAPKVPPLPAEEPIKPKDQTKPAPPAPPKDWVTPGPETKKVEKPPEAPVTPGGAKEGTGTSPLTGGSGPGANYGVPNGTGNGGAALTKLPKLLNLDDVLANLKRFYPEIERRAGHEGTVLVDLHIGVDGKVESVDVVDSAGVHFDNAAKAVAFLMLFSPAEDARGPVPVKIRQSMVFQLQD